MKTAGARPLPVGELSATAHRHVSAVVADYVALTKPRLNMLVVATSAAAYYLGAPGRPDYVTMAQAVAGTALVAAGAAVLNQLAERDTDALMRRTRGRPLPAGRVRPDEARAWGMGLAGAGLTILALGANVLAAFLACATITIYLAIYTPMKRRFPASTLVGAIPGASPGLIGWTAARGSMGAGGYALFAIVFLWQIPHFMAIAWLYRDDYAAAGFPMLPVIEPDGRRAGRQALLYALALLPVSLTPALTGTAGQVYVWTALLLGAAMLALAARFWRARTEASARALFFGSITYLPLLWVVMVLDHDIAGSAFNVLIHVLPAVNATLNGVSAVLLLIGYLLIRSGRIAQHRRVMISAFITSSVFLVCYLVYHAQVGSVRFTRYGFVRPLYFTILITHVTLAALVLPLAVLTLSRGLKARYGAHRAIARWTFPIWMYVSVTGVLVYVLLYQPTWLL